jgi:CheY-like chemotaxis protein
MIGACLAYFHPTTVVIVDDNEQYLENVELLLPDSSIFRGFIDPHDALASCNTFRDRIVLADEAFSVVEDADSHALVRVDRDSIVSEVSNARRFAFPSVLVTDYAMPSMNGIELCRRIGNPRIKKMLITGVTDEREAVKAFNSKIIDAFVMKGDAAAVQQITDGVRALQYGSFFEEQRTLLSSIAFGAYSFLNDAVVGDHLSKLVLNGSCSEYYLSTDPTGYVLVSPEGEFQTLAIYDDSGIEKNVLEAIRMGAPGDVIRAVEARTHAISLPTSGEAARSPLDWNEVLVPMERLRGEGGSWYVGIGGAPALDVDYDPRYLSADAFRQQL